MSLPVSRPTGRALVITGPGNRGRVAGVLGEMGYGATEVDDPYAAMAELCRRPLVYRAVILSLASLYREELAIIPAVKARFAHVEVWLAQTDGRQAALAEGMRLGADGLLADDGLHRVAQPATPAPPTGTTAAASWSDGSPAAGKVKPTHARAPHPADDPAHDATAPEPAGPILTADELRALLHEQSPVPPDEP